MHKHQERIDLAIVIPTLNEEHFVGYLLDSIIKQAVWPKEIVVVDVYSQDQTVEQVKLRQSLLPQLKLFQIPKFTVSRQRNFGAQHTSARHLLFLDADTELRGANVLKRYFEQIKKTNPDLAVVTNNPTTNYWKDKVFFTAMDLLFKILKPIWPLATGINMYIKRQTFERIGGFDENITVGEDFEIVYRLVKAGGKFSIISDPKIHTSPRRFEKEGRIKLTLKSIWSFFRIVRKGYKDIPLKYEFGHFTAADQPRKRP
ncbi:glycosyltransferase [Candidatus Daviesbacteria bacterium]|nr:glycosyltransferase [Candidatus Daviesbacteria bacterium]